jgi:hypothetical protein
MATLLGKASASRLSDVPLEEEPPRPEGSAERDDRDAEAEADLEDREDDMLGSRPYSTATFGLMLL